MDNDQLVARSFILWGVCCRLPRELRRGSLFYSRLQLLEDMVTYRIRAIFYWILQHGLLYILDTMIR